MKVKSIKEVAINDKAVLLRADLDGPVRKIKGRWKSVDEIGLRVLLPTINFLEERNAKTIIIGHLGRPEGKMVESLRMDPVARKLSRDVGGIRKLDDCLGSEVNAAVKQAGRGDILLLENLRFYPEEEANDSGFAQELASLAEIYVNECFSASHRAHASIVGIPKFLPHAAGFHFAKEIEVLSQVLEGPRRPVVIVVGGVKEDKFRLIPKFLKIADFVLVGGWLLKRIPQTRQLADGKKIFACLTPDGRDITKESANRLAGIIEKGGTVVWSGPMGIYEDERDIEGTRIIAEAIANSRALRIAGGGDTETAINFLGLKEKFDWISSGGGAMLEFLAEGTLPGIEALKE